MPWTAFWISILRILAFAWRDDARARLVAENILLRQQNAVYQRKLKWQPLKAADRIIFAFITSFISPTRLPKICTLVTPATLLAYHRALVSKKYSILFGSKRMKPGPKGPSPELIRFVVEVKQRNPSYGCEKIALLVNQRTHCRVSHQTVRRILRKHLPMAPKYPPGPSWSTFLAQSRDSLWALDLFRAESISLQSYWVLVVMDVWSRKIIGFGAHKGSVYGEDLCCMFNQIAHGKKLPRFLSRDRDPLFRFEQWQANLRLMEIEEKRSLPDVPISHPFIERVIGTTRREFFDHTFFWNKVDLEKKLAQFQEYYNSDRVHSSLNGQTPAQKRGDISFTSLDLGNVAWKAVCGGFYQVPMTVSDRQIR